MFRGGFEGRGGVFLTLRARLLAPVQTPKLCSKCRILQIRFSNAENVTIFIFAPHCILSIVNIFSFQNFYADFGASHPANSKGVLKIYSVTRGSLFESS